MTRSRKVSSAHLAQAQQIEIDPNKGRSNGLERGWLKQIANKLNASGIKAK